MIWDRFDDAMGDLRREGDDVREHIMNLERQLQELGEEPPDEDDRAPTAEYSADAPADRAHREAFDEVARLRARERRLIDLVANARNRRYAPWRDLDFTAVPPRVWTWETGQWVEAEAHVGPDGVAFVVDDMSGSHGGGAVRYDQFFVTAAWKMHNMPDAIRKEIEAHVRAHARPLSPPSAGASPAGP